MLKTNYKSQLVKINRIAGILYTTPLKSKNMVVYGLGAPRVPDDGSLKEASTVMSFDTDLFVPDYIGYGRSDGILTPKNCIKTFLTLYKNFSDGCVGENSYLKNKIKLRYERVMFIGRSFGGTYLPLLSRFNYSIKEICLVFPAVNNSVYGSMPNEESNEDFMRAMLIDGYKHLYRGVSSNAWKNHLNEKDDLSPMDEKNILYLKNSRVFIGHGKEDKILNFSRSVKYYNRVQNIFQNRKNFKLTLYSKGGHNSETAQKIITNYLTWSNINRR